MSSDLARIQSASALRTWEESRSKRFACWREAVVDLTTGLRGVLRRGAAQSRQIDAFLRERGAAERLYAQALLSPPQAAAGPPAKGAEKDKEKQKQPEGALGADPQPTEPRSPLLEAVAALQRATAQARGAFAAGLLEGSTLGGLSATTAEFEKTGGAIVQGLESGLRDVVEAHAKAAEAMVAYHRASIEGRRRVLDVASAGEPPGDAWLHEHRYRRAVAVFRDRQHCFTVQMCGAVQEARKLEEWRAEMSRKMLRSYCFKLHQMETGVQSLANDGVRALADTERNPSERNVLLSLEELLCRAVPAQSPAAQLVAAGEPEAVAGSEWPALQRLVALSQQGRLPTSALGRMCGPLKVPRRWYGSQICVVVLTKDDWLHCFHLSAETAAAPTSRTASAPSAGPKGHRKGANGAEAPAVAADRPGGGPDGLDTLEAEPQWSMYIPGASVTSPVAGRVRCFEIEEVRRGFLGLRSSRRELLQADTDEDLERWTAALVEARSARPLAGAESAAARASASLPPDGREAPEPARAPTPPRPKPPPPPPPPAAAAAAPAPQPAADAAAAAPPAPSGAAAAAASAPAPQQPVASRGGPEGAEPAAGPPPGAQQPVAPAASPAPSTAPSSPRESGGGGGQGQAAAPAPAASAEAPARQVSDPVPPPTAATGGAQLTAAESVFG